MSKPKKERKGEFDLLVVSGDQKKSAEVDSDELADGLIGLKPVLKEKVLVTLKKGDSSLTRLLFVPQARRVFNNHLAAEIFCRNMVRGLSS